MNIHEIIANAREQKASDIHISQDMDLMFRVHGRLRKIALPGADFREIILSITDKKQREIIEQGNDLDFALNLLDGRQRVNIFHQQGKLAATIRLLNDFIPNFSDLGLPEVVGKLAEQPAGLILVTGPTGSGKSTTLAAMRAHIAKLRPEHIITIEDPIEYVYPQGQSLIHQREVGRDTKTFASALRSALREDPDVILVGEMRDFETISAAVTAAETGHLVLSTLHTISAAQTIDRVIDACPEGIQSQIRTQLGSILRGVVTQKLLPLATGQGRTVATEVLIGTDAVLNLIREGKCHQLSTIMQSGQSSGMHTMNADLARLVRQGKITKEEAVAQSLDRKDLMQHMI